MTRGMSFVLAQYYLFMRQEHVYADISHIPGRENVISEPVPTASSGVAEVLIEHILLERLVESDRPAEFSKHSQMACDFSSSACPVKMHVNEDRLGFGGLLRLVVFDWCLPYV